MSAPAFEWDPSKNSANLRKHKVSFAEAATAFSDDNALMIDDPDHSDEEDRFILLGLSTESRLLVIVHCYRHAMASYVLFLPERRPLANALATITGDIHEKGV